MKQVNANIGMGGMLEEYFPYAKIQIYYSIRL